jgi:hypothetical protein
MRLSFARAPTKTAVLLLLAASAGCSADPPAESVSRTAHPSFQPSAVPSAPASGQALSPPVTSTAPAAMSPATMPGAKSPDASARAAPDAGPAELPTVCAADDGGANDEDAAATRACVVVGDLHLQYLAADTHATDNQIKPHFNVVNHGTHAVDLKDLTIRYWYSDASTPDLTFSCDYAQIDCANISGAFASIDRSEANHYLELSFKAGSLAGGMQTGEIQARFNRADWSNFDQSDDYSFDPSKTSFADWYKVTLYRRGSLVWGAAPR